MRTFFQITIVFLLSGQALAQYDNRSDHRDLFEQNRPPYQLFEDTTSKKSGLCSGIGCGYGGCFGDNARLIFSLDGRSSFLANRPQKFGGLRFGFEVYRKYRFGFGLYATQGTVVVEQLGDTLERRVGFNYTTLFFEYVFYQDFRWEFSGVGAIGSGVAPGTDRNLITDETAPFVISDKRLSLTSVGVGGHYRFIPFAALGLGVGYRRVISSATQIPDPELRKAVNAGLSAPYYAIKVKFFLGDLWKWIAKPQEIRDMKNEYLEQKSARKQARLDKKTGQPEGAPEPEQPTQ